MIVSIEFCTFDLIETVFKTVGFYLQTNIIADLKYPLAHTARARPRPRQFAQEVQCSLVGNSSRYSILYTMYSGSAFLSGIYRIW